MGDGQSVSLGEGGDRGVHDLASCDRHRHYRKREVSSPFPTHCWIIGKLSNS